MITKIKYKYRRLQRRYNKWLAYKYFVKKHCILFDACPLYSPSLFYYYIGEQVANNFLDGLTLESVRCNDN